MTFRTNIPAIEDMIEYGGRTVAYLDGRSAAELAADKMRSDAVARALLVMGEACKRLPDAIRLRFPEVPWKEIARTRDRLIHHYHGVDWAVVHDIVTAHIPDALLKLGVIRDRLLAEEPPPPVEPRA